MKKSIETLARLQEVEKRIARLERDLERAPQRYETLEAERDEMRASLAAVEERLAAMQKRYRELDREARQQQDQAKKREARLHEVKTNREYHAALKEIDEIRAAASRVEDEMIGLLDEIEAAEAQLAAEREHGERRGAELDADAAEVEAAMAADRQRLEAEVRDRDAVAAKVAPDLLTTYRHACIQQGDGVGVAAVRKAVCQGCHMNIPPQLYNELQRRDSIKNCPLCHRIIYWQEDI